MSVSSLAANEIPCTQLQPDISMCDPYTLYKLPIDSSFAQKILDKYQPLSANTNSTIELTKLSRAKILNYPTKFISVTLSNIDEIKKFDNYITKNKMTHDEESFNEYDNVAAIEQNDPDHMVAVESYQGSDSDYQAALPAQPKTYGTYTVKKGDTLSTIAKRFMVDPQEIAKDNKMGKNLVVRLGQKLKIVGTQEHIDNINNASYTVKRGDSLIKIAKVYDLELELLKKYNKLPKNLILRVGQKLVLPLPHKLVKLKEEEEKKRQAELEKKRKIAKAKKLARLKKKREKERKARLAQKKRDKGKFKRKLRVLATAYVSVPSQTDSTPFIAAWENHIRPGMKIIAVSHDLIRDFGITNGSRVKISGLRGVYTVRDKMNKKWRRKIDIYMGLNNARAMRWGKRRVMLYY